MIDTPILTETAARHIAVIRFTVPRAEIRTVMGPGLAELRAGVAAQGAAPNGPWFTHHRWVDPARFDFEIGVPVDAPVAAAGRVAPAEWPAMRAAQTVYRGGYEGLGAAWGAFDAWIVRAGHAPADDLWECFVVGPDTSADPAEWRTELTRPLR